MASRFNDHLRYLLASLTLVSASCSQSLDAGSTRARGALPVDERNPILITNDGAMDNWQGEYALLLAAHGGPELSGIVINASPAWPDLEANVAGWRSLIAAARASGIGDVPDPVASIGAPLVRPASGEIEATTPNRSEGARFILDSSVRLGLPYRPLVVVTGGRMTDVADAYLLDPTITERVIVVSSLGKVTANGAAMGIPNGEMDPWADAIVSSRFRYVQVSAYYDQRADVPDSRIAELPTNAFGSWMAAKQPKLFDLPEGADQVAVAAVGIPNFAVATERVSVAGLAELGTAAGPELVFEPDGAAWLVTESAGALAAARLWQSLLDPRTFSQ